MGASAPAPFFGELCSGNTRTNSLAAVQRIRSDWHGPVIVAASGPSLTEKVAWECRRARWFGPYRIVCVSDAYKLFLNGDILYSCDAAWWEHHQGATAFRGERWSSQGDDKAHNDDKYEVADKYGLNLVSGRPAVGFSLDPDRIHYGQNSGFQAVNLAILKGATKIVLVGFDMRRVDDKSHFFGDHPSGLRNPSEYKTFVRAFEKAQSPVPIINATPGSALTCFPMEELTDALGNYSQCHQKQEIYYPGIEEAK